ncbi:MAG: DNA alkylation repair protein [Sphaerochaetaceae bacterium]|nr:DNA alkylation repair protein [Sphaerochaetaceae bacterium]
MDLKDRLFNLQDTKYKSFQSSLIPSVKLNVIGVRTPDLRRLAKEVEDKDLFISSLPHTFFEENQIHAFIISSMKDFNACVSALEAFLPFVDNWATCDQMSPKIFKKHRAELLPYIYTWLESGRTYTVRFGIKMLMEHFLDEDFDEKYICSVSAVKSDEYYVKMMVAWYFATALAKQYSSALPFIENRVLDKWTHNKSIQKAVESFRVSDEHKMYLRTLKT